MSWQSDDGRHEGYAAHVVRDGREAVSTTSAGLHLDHESRWTGSEWTGGEVLPWSELLGWEARCVCGWVGPMYRRTGDQQDAEELELQDAGPGVETAEDAVRVAWLLHLKAQGADQ